MKDLFDESDCDGASASVLMGNPMYFKNDCISLAKANAKFREWVEKQPVVYGTAEKLKVGQFEMHLQRYDWATHQARIVMIEPIEPPDSADAVLGDFIAYANSLGGHDDSKRFDALIERARKLKERK